MWGEMHQVTPYCLNASASHSSHGSPIPNEASPLHVKNSASVHEKQIIGTMGLVLVALPHLQLKISPFGRDV